MDSLFSFSKSIGNEFNEIYRLEKKLILNKFEHPCLQFPKDYVLKLCIRQNIFGRIKYSNRDIKIKQKDKINVRKLNI